MFVTIPYIIIFNFDLKIHLRTIFVIICVHSPQYTCMETSLFIWTFLHFWTTGTYPFDFVDYSSEPAAPSADMRLLMTSVNKYNAVITCGAGHAPVAVPLFGIAGPELMNI